MRPYPTDSSNPELLVVKFIYSVYFLQCEKEHLAFVITIYFIFIRHVLLARCTHKIDSHRTQRAKDIEERRATTLRSWWIMRTKSDVVILFSVVLRRNRWYYCFGFFCFLKLHSLYDQQDRLNIMIKIDKLQHQNNNTDARTLIFLYSRASERENPWSISFCIQYPTQITSITNVMLIKNLIELGKKWWRSAK